MGNRYLIIDIGEAQGRHILGYIEEGKLKLEVIHRFNTVFLDKNGERCWDTEHLFTEVKAGMIKCREAGKLPIFVGISAWGNDFVLLDKEDKILGDVISDHNTISRLKSVKEQNPNCFDKAESLLMLPDYLNFLLTGRKSCEFSNAIATKLINWETKDWDVELIEMQGFPRRIFTAVSQAGSILGNLKIEVTEELYYDCIIVQPASRRAGAAIMKFPGQDIILDIEAEMKAPAGNLMVLMISSHEIKDLMAAKECLRKTFEME